MPHHIILLFIIYLLLLRRDDVVVSEELAADDEPLNLARSLVEHVDLGVAHELLDGILFVEAVAAKYLHSVGGDFAWEVFFALVKEPRPTQLLLDAIKQPAAGQGRT